MQVTSARALNGVRTTTILDFAFGQHPSYRTVDNPHIRRAASEYYVAVRNLTQMRRLHHMAGLEGLPTEDLRLLVQEAVEVEWRKAANAREAILGCYRWGVAFVDDACLFLGSSARAEIPVYLKRLDGSRACPMCFGHRLQAGVACHREPPVVPCRVCRGEGRLTDPVPSWLATLAAGR
jgi:hypothetical protein